MRTFPILCAFALLLAGCPTGGLQSNRPPAGTATSKVQTMNDAAKEVAARPEESADAIKVQHLLISFGGAGTRATRPKDEAQDLAAELFAKAKAGEDFDALIVKHTDDSPPGIYDMVKDPAKEDLNKGIFARKSMVAAFGNVGWRLKVGEIGIAPYHSTESPFGWHIIKRLK